ncbi:MAG: peptidoglycan DD-metalloendopeptidase family protein [Patescibacteria group bacterium]
MSSNRRARKPLLYVALGAIFLLAGIGISLKTLTDSKVGEVNMLLMGQGTGAQKGVFSAQVRSDQVVAFEAPELVLLDKTSVIAVTPPMTVGANVLGALIGDSSDDTKSKREILYYVVEEGDTIDVLAERFGISTNTIVWANDLSSSSQLTPGQELVILPTSGALHLIRPQDTLSEIAVWYRGSVEEILEFNEIESAQDIFVGDLLIIPDGRKPTTLPNGRLTPLANAYFILPVPRSYKTTQGLHPFNAVDFSNGTCGGPAYAAAGGITQQVGYHSLAGNYVRILHPNGVVTFYGHLSSQAASPGERVLQGQIVGYIGHSGYTIPSGQTGCHLHFEVRGAQNPFAK